MFYIDKTQVKLSAKMHLKCVFLLQIKHIDGVQTFLIQNDSMDWYRFVYFEAWKPPKRLANG